MVAIITCNRLETNHIEFKEQMYPPSRREEWDWTTTRDDEFWTKGRHITLIATPDRAGVFWVTRLGLTKREKKAADRKQKLRILHITLLEHRVQLGELLDQLDARHRRHLISEGQQTEATGRALLATLMRLRPEAQRVVSYINAATDGFRIRPESKAEHALAEERDATLAVARMAGMAIPQLARWDPPAEELSDDVPPPAYLGLLHAAATQTESAESAALEDHLINRDTERLVGWLGEDTGHVAWRQFQQHGQRLFIGNANRAPAERISGTDIIYYHDTRKSLVLVQYKKLNSRRNGYYYPNSDRGLAKELTRLRAVDRYAAHFRRPSDDHRLCPNPSWIKLCPPESVIPQADVMVPGMYFSRQHFEQLRSDPRMQDGRGGAVRFGYANVPSYLDNTMFTRLVETGMIGTTGVSTELVRWQITRSIKQGRMAIVGFLTGDEAPQSVRNSRRRQNR
ncbi:hypothetical protein IU470_24455 [Nocardia abscessus]|uniref:NERD domain-containing protein n=1 Tax=Nocardia abscessus TaxID=120957 RepID=A0ABS0CD20_9NOCA|nr:hypothetical protein [Nocardia abscessus]MBF6228247.1 hypothetical protein [Nocardia abscessus]